MAKVRFRKFRRGETTANVFALPAVKELTERATSRYGDYFAPIKYKGDLDELTRRVKLIARGTYRTKYTSEKFHEKLSPGAAAKRRKEGTLGYTSQAAARQAEKTSLGRKINAALRKPERARLETHKERAKNPGRFTGSPRVSPRRGVAALRKTLFEGEKLEDGDWHELRDYLHTIDARELYNMIDGRHYRRPEAAVIL